MKDVKIESEDFFQTVFNNGWAHLVTPVYWNGEFSSPDPPPNLYKISLCTTCMDRLSDLKITLPKKMINQSGDSVPCLKV